MKTNIVLYLLVTTILTNCYSPTYLPSYKKIDINPFGSFIIVNKTNRQHVYGELIAVDSNRIILLADINKKCLTINRNEIKYFSLQYAKIDNWTGPLFTLLSLTHGVVIPITLPINIASTTSNPFKYTHYSNDTFNKKSKRNISYDQLKMFARFPQGIPPGIKLESVQ